MKIIACFLTLVISVSAQATPQLLGAAKCQLTTASPSAKNWQRAFNLVITSDGYEVVEGASHVFKLVKIDPSRLIGWPDYGGTYYSTSNDALVLITPADMALPPGVAFRVIKPLDTDPNTHQRPSVFNCIRTM